MSNSGPEHVISLFSHHFKGANGGSLRSILLFNAMNVVCLRSVETDVGQKSAHTFVRMSKRPRIKKQPPEVGFVNSEMSKLGLEVLVSMWEAAASIYEPANSPCVPITFACRSTYCVCKQKP